MSITSIIDCSDLYNNAAENQKLDSRAVWLDRSIQKELHNASGAFNNGIAIILGKVWHNPHKAGQHMICVDLDNQKHILSIHTELVEALRKNGCSNCITLLRDIVRRHSSFKIVHESHTHPTLVESRRERATG